MLTYENVRQAWFLVQCMREAHILKSQHIVPLYSEYARAQTF